MSAVRLRPIEERDRGEVAELIAVSTNTWDVAHGFVPGRFTGGAPPGRMPLVLVPREATELVSLLYHLGGRNVELHAVQVRGPAEPFAGVCFATFMPETG